MTLTQAIKLAIERNDQVAGGLAEAPLVSAAVPCVPHTGQGRVSSKAEIELDILWTPAV